MIIVTISRFDEGSQKFIFLRSNVASTALILTLIATLLLVLQALAEVLGIRVRCQRVLGGRL